MEESEIIHKKQGKASQLSRDEGEELVLQLFSL